MSLSTLSTTSERLQHLPMDRIVNFTHLPRKAPLPALDEDFNSLFCSSRQHFFSRQRLDRAACTIHVQVTLHNILDYLYTVSSSSLQDTPVYHCRSSWCYPSRRLLHGTVLRLSRRTGKYDNRFERSGHWSFGSKVLGASSSAYCNSHIRGRRHAS